MRRTINVGGLGQEFVSREAQEGQYLVPTRALLQELQGLFLRDQAIAGTVAGDEFRVRVLVLLKRFNQRLETLEGKVF